MEYVIHLLLLVLLFATVAASLDLLVGQAGIPSLAQGAFFGIGAYTSAILLTQTSAPFLLACTAAAGLSAFSSLLLSLPACRLRSDYFAIASFGFQVVFFELAKNWESLTNGSYGIRSIPDPRVSDWVANTETEYLVLAALFLAVSLFVLNGLSRSGFGRVLRSLREDEIATKSVGRNPVPFKIAAFAVSAALTGATGALWASHLSFIEPRNFDISLSIFLISMVIVGGADSTWGPLLGAAILVIVPELLRFVGIPAAFTGPLQQLVLGVILVLIVTLRPQGLVGRFDLGG